MIKPVEATAMLASCNMWLGGLCCSDSYTKLVCFLSHPVVLSSFIQLPLQLDYHLRCELSKKKICYYSYMFTDNKGYEYFRWAGAIPDTSIYCDGAQHNKPRHTTLVVRISKWLFISMCAKMLSVQHKNQRFDLIDTQPQISNQILHEILKKIKQTIN